MSHITRRKFLKSAAAGAALAPFAIARSTRLSAGRVDANDTIRVAVAGIHGQGGFHIKQLAGMDKVRVTHLADPDSSLFDARKRQVKGAGRKRGHVCSGRTPGAG